MEIEQLVEPREEEVNGVLRHNVRLGETVRVFLRPVSGRAKQQDDSIRTCIISRSFTNLRSVSTISRTALIRSASFAFVGGDGASDSSSASNDGFSEYAGEDGGGLSNAPLGRLLTMAVTVLMT